jgi:deoxycytidine triphosphate deaminase
VDPKNFDEKCFVDMVGDVCIIPPNSFALARTVEKFKIPRDVLTICLGKSTYARCFTGDTKVLCSDNVGRTFLELVDAWKAGVSYPIYCMSESGEIVVSYYENPRLVGREKVIEVFTNIGLQTDANRSSFKSTPDHEHFTSMTQTVRSDQLKPGDSLMIPWVYKRLNTSGNEDKTREYRAESIEIVESVVECEGIHDVYCLTAPMHGNFILADSGVITKNCGIIVNVTPFEPEWEGYVTLEFSNTTPLPAKIYAGEGCAQVLFLQGSEPCETSYRDRGGKYQGQTGVVIPRL